MLRLGKKREKADPDPQDGAHHAIDAAGPDAYQSTETLKQGDSFAVFDRLGDIDTARAGAAGLYHTDTRRLSRYALTIDDRRPLLLSSSLRDDNVMLTNDLTNPSLGDSGGERIAHGTIHIRRSRFLWRGACYERISVRNFDRRPHSVAIAFDFAADFADLFEVRGERRRRRGEPEKPVVTRDRVVLAYRGLDDIRRETALQFDPAPDRLTPERATFRLTLAPRETRLLFAVVSFADRDDDERPSMAFLTSYRDARRRLRQLSERAAAVDSSNEIFNEAVRRSVADLYMLTTEKSEGLYPYAGVPWFSTPFGRDALITALQTLWLDPAIARGVLAFLADTQAQNHDAEADAEPGKILHEVRSGEMAMLGEVPFRRYYGSVDSTPLFVMLAGAYFQRTADLGFAKRLWPNIERALEWIDRHGDRDGDGFVEYGRQTDDGLVNQAWKDSHDSVFHADGATAEGPIAIVEVQGYVYAAKIAAASIAEALRRDDRASSLRAEAQLLRERFDAAFWDDDLGFYVLALDGEKRRCRVRASNAGHALYSGVALESRAEPVVRLLMDRTFFSGWGVRTLAASEARYNPMSYHNGSVWPHDCAMIAEGCARYGFPRAAARILSGLFEASVYIELRRLPELFCGFARRRGQGPTFYPVACSPQAWAATAQLSILRSCLGLQFDPAANEIRFNRPAMPDFLDEVVLANLSLGENRVDVGLRRAGASVSARVLARRGDTEITICS